VIATSAAYADSSDALRRWRDKVRVVPIGIGDNREAADADAVRGLRERFGGRRIVFSLGRMTYYKGFDVLVEAAASLPDDCVVLIGGEGDLLEDLRRTVVARGLGDRVHVLGHVPDHELPTHFAACDVFCMPSTVRAEAYGVAIVEAMVMGKPVVATDIVGSGVPWVNVHGVTGLNVPVRDAPALAGALNRLLSDPAMRHRLGTVARLRYTQEFRGEVMIGRTLALYEALGVAARREPVAPSFGPTRPLEVPASTPEMPVAAGTPVVVAAAVPVAPAQASPVPGVAAPYAANA
jgi:rhamnosyl/mannosyltransferase